MNPLDHRNRRLGADLVVSLALLIFRFLDWALGWPLFILVPGAALLTAAASGGRSASALFIPGGFVTTVGTILFAQNATGRFENWAYAWALIPASVGMMLHGGSAGNPDLVRQERRQAPSRRSSSGTYSAPDSSAPPCP